ncbi:rhodanese-like domain-containing protein [Pontiella agarivorans]|uniref:Rhodanese-like domain-containing protein n=1 Tax=Pontiella agarivorans TaxID=3038953 RepID=A0ABU5N0G6_9BACT|nr:rhodanese-like domain-containing protein [Pontiella agarivorans]MDZ8119949.1 rhodanese-like domain-containing protein [Pontiella agarivorans]
MIRTLGKMLLAIVVGILAVNLLYGGKGDKRDGLSALVEDGALLIDTRTAGEFQRGHVKGAINIPHDTIAGVIDQHTTDKAAPIIVYCRSGNRSAHAKRDLINAGYTNVIDAGSIGNMQRNMPK